MLYTTNILVVCHVVDDECNGGRVSSCTRRVSVVVCHVVHDEYCGRVSCCRRRV